MKKMLIHIGLSLLVISLLVVATIGFLDGPASLTGWAALTAIGTITLTYLIIDRRRYLRWKPSYSVGIEVIDQDHRRLLHLINRFQNAVHYPVDDHFTQQTLNELVAYTRYHFAREENLLEEYGFPDLEQHRQQHNDMIAKVEEAIARYEYAPEDSIEDLIEFLKQWLIHHICGSDRAYGPYLNQHGIR
jgi:hemerythrin